MSRVLLYQVTERREKRREGERRGREGRGKEQGRGREERTDRGGEEEHGLILRTILTRTVTGAPESLTFICSEGFSSRP